uniref:Uncharacterized protein n=1 Tax=Salmonella sp. TaxID=599 RepID=A0A482EX28_SALSP|nr:hypothetical protein NNIBIDOC_00065 [Salmonella sp.]
MAGGRKIKMRHQRSRMARYGNQIPLQLYPAVVDIFWDVPTPPAAANHSVRAGNGE